MKKILSAIRNSLRENSLLKPKNRLLCAFSGGQDSTLLLFCFLHYQIEFDIELETLYCHHFIQLNNFFCFWQILRINSLFQIPISFIFTIKYLTNENHARIWRKSSFERVFALQECSKLLIGHTASDRIETAISKLNRGTSSQGLINLTLTGKHQNSSILVFFPVILLTKKTKQANKITFLLFKKQLFQHFYFLWPVPGSFFEKIAMQKLKLKNFHLIKPGSLFSTNSNDKKQSQILQKTKVSQKKFFLITNTKRSLSMQQGLQTQVMKYFSLTYSLYSSQKKFSFFILRPILNVHRNDVVTLCKIYKLPLVSDFTNDLPEISRNKIRHQLMPFYRYFFSSKIDFFTYRCLNILMLEHDYVENLIKNLLTILKENLPKKISNFQLVNKNSFVDFEISQKKYKIQSFFKTLSIPLQRLCIKKIFFYATNTELNYSQIEFLRFLIQKT